MSDKTWFYESDGSPQGPITEAQIKLLIEENKLHGETLVWTQGEDDWRPLKEFFTLERQTPPPLPKKQASLKSSDEQSDLTEKHNPKAFQRGYVARVAGRTLRSNPYLNTWDKASWEAGWQEKNRAILANQDSNMGSSPTGIEDYRPSYLRLFVHLVLVAFIMLVLSSAANVTVSELDQQGYDPSLLGSGAVLQALFIWAVAAAIAEFKGQYIKRIWQVTSVAIAVYLLLIFVALSLVGST